MATISGNRLSPEVLDYLVNDSPVRVGYICFKSADDESTLPPEKIAVYTRVTEGPTLSISPQYLQLSAYVESDSDDDSDIDDDMEEEEV
eukprot:Pgem_evm1s13952